VLDTTTNKEIVMTVKELIEKLKELDPDSEVITYNYVEENEHTKAIEVYHAFDVEQDEAYPTVKILAK
jgi:hypothetical protein